MTESFKGHIAYVLKDSSGKIEVKDLTDFRYKTTQVDQNKGLDDILRNIRNNKLRGGELIGFFNQTQLDKFLKENNI